MIPNNHMIAQHRLISQQLAGSNFTTPRELIRWMGCMQATDYASAGWAIAARMKDISAAAIDEAFRAGHILRTYLLGPVPSFVAPEDIGWIRLLTAPRMKALHHTLHHKLGIDPPLLQRCRQLITAALLAKGELTRAQLVQYLRKHHINTDPIRFNFLLMDAEINGILCSSRRQGNQFMYVLQAAYARPAGMEYEEALMLMTEKYFSSRGPATLQDFSYWSGLETSVIRRGIDMAQQRLAYTVVSGQAYWYAAEMPLPESVSDGLQLLPSGDEYLTAYEDLSDVSPAAPSVFRSVVLLNGRVAGTWQCLEKRQTATLTIRPFRPVDGQLQELITAAAGSYQRYLHKEHITIKYNPVRE
ncbi:winged helix DNA-binding domain-containing protein [Chitinophaga sp. Mgbs1]|uniref:Winged helix DNA-binding domain-containing protein n=1 Tax=Chitinophaga solisilvae TaxID=1233460 RepID=A0A3S1B0T5_9BACT|nr:winged helix DNA-binding domain-containing protein [Chitinophaga solisilvae]